MSPASSSDAMLHLLDVDDTGDDRGDDHFVGNQPVVTDLPKVYGGQLFAQALAAMARTAPPGRRAHAVQATFLAAGDLMKPIELTVVRDRDGRSFSARSVLASQAGRAVMRGPRRSTWPKRGWGTHVRHRSRRGRTGCRAWWR